MIDVACNQCPALAPLVYRIRACDLKSENLVESGCMCDDMKGNLDPGGVETMPSKGGNTSRALGCSSFLPAQRVCGEGKAPNSTSRRLGPRDTPCSSKVDSSAGAASANDPENGMGARTIV